MTIATYQISDADVGTTIGPQNGFVTGLTMLSPPTVFETPDWDPGRQWFKSGYFTIRGEGDLRPIFNAQIGAGVGHFSYWGGEAHSIVDGNFLKGALKIVSVPKGSTWLVSVSDIPRNFSGSNYVPHAPPPAPKPVSDRAAAMERQMLPRQLSNSRRDATNRPA
jgi:hypothetical protein